MTQPAASAIRAYEGTNLALQISSEEQHVARCQRLRYKIYCVERGWYDEVRISKGHELDAYDDRASHAMLRRTDSSEGIGVVRLILPCRDGDDVNLPIQEISPNPLELIPEKIDMSKLAEVSRFAVTREVRRWSPVPEESKFQELLATSRRGTLFSVFLMRAVVLMARENDIDYLCATMEPALILHLARMGIRFESLGEPKDYHGLRQPCYASLARINDEMVRQRPDIHPLVFPPADEDENGLRL